METKTLQVTKQEIELILDSFKVSSPLTRGIALKAAGLVLEWAAEDQIKQATKLVETGSTGGHIPIVYREDA